MFGDRIRRSLRSFLGLDDFQHLEEAVIELSDLEELKKVFGWEEDGVLDDPTVHEFRYLEDVNQRRLHDARVLATVVRNAARSGCLEIGTAAGHSTALMACNAPDALIHTVNIPPEEYGEGGELKTVKMSREEIGAYYRQKGLENIRQIYANTATWEPDVEGLDVAFIDGCHDTEFVINDTLKVLERMRNGGFILWHDFNPSLIPKFHWIRSVCRGVETLLARGALSGRILHVRDSWTGVHCVE